MKKVIRKIINKKISQFQFYREFKEFKKLSLDKKKRFELSWKDKYPILNEKKSISGFDAHYIYHLAWATRLLYNQMPQRHVDISSSLHFSTMVSSFVPVLLCDYHKVNINLDNIETQEIDLYSLPFEDGSINSLSCMHVVEHIGLGRYGDKMDYEGDIKAMIELQRVISKNGLLYFVVPIGKPKILFNAHRIYGYNDIIDSFPNLTIESFMLIPDNAKKNGVIYNASEKICSEQNYGCGCFLFRKQ